MMKRLLGRGGVVCWLMAAFVAASLGCNAANNTGASSGTNKPASQKPAGTTGAPGKTPKPDPG